jgi:nucleotide-binding universal stress UspA family protein
MFQRVIVPFDGSDFSWRAIGPALALARQCDAPVELFQVVMLPGDVLAAEQFISDRLAEIDVDGVGPVEIEVAVLGDTVASTIAAHAEQTDGSVVVMSTVGRGRSAALIGSIAEELLGCMFGPIMLVGPDARLDRPDFSGKLIVTVDGSETSETALPLAAALGISLGARPWVVSVIEPGAGDSGDVSSSAYPSRLAHRLAETSHHPVEFEVLSGDRPDRSISDYASAIDASLIVTSTHGRTGLARIRAGSVAMAIVKRAPCPVVLNRPPHLR